MMLMTNASHWAMSPKRPRSSNGVRLHHFQNELTFPIFPGHAERGPEDLEPCLGSRRF